MMSVNRAAISVERLVPCDPLETSLALLADASQRMEHPLVAVDAVEELVDLGAQLALAYG